MKAIVAAVVLAWAQVAAAQTVRYAPGRATYEQTVVISTSGGILGGRAGGAGGPLELTQYMRFSVDAKALGGDTLELTFTVDSSAISGLDGLGQDGLPSGTQVQQRITALGRHIGDSTQRPAAMAALAGVFPAVMQGARVGSAWEDTLDLGELAGMFMGQSLDGTILRTVLISKDTAYGGEPAWKIDMGSQIEVSGAELGGRRGRGRGALRGRRGGDAAAGARRAGGRGGDGGGGGGDATGATRAGADGDQLAAMLANLQLSAEGSGQGVGTAYLSKAGMLLFATDQQTVSVTISLGGPGGGGGASFPLQVSTTRTLKRLN